MIEGVFSLPKDLQEKIRDLAEFIREIGLDIRLAPTEARIRRIVIVDIEKDKDIGYLSWKDIMDCGDMMELMKLMVPM